MPTVTIRIDERTEARLKRRLAKSGESLSDFIRDAMSKHLDSPPRPESRLKSLDRVLAQIGDTGETDLSTTYKKRYKERLLAKHRR